MPLMFASKNLKCFMLFFLIREMERKIYQANRNKLLSDSVSFVFFLQNTLKYSFENFHLCRNGI